MMIIFGGLGLGITAFLSAGINLMGASLGAATFITTAAFNNAAVRRRLGLEERPVYYESSISSPAVQTPAKPVYEAPRATGLQGIKERLADNVADMQKGIKDKLANATGVHSGTEAEKQEKKKYEEKQHMIKKMEEKRRQQQREEFERKWKQGP
jgi:YidC/Oxa1 family membrane protein insertase